MLSNKELEIIQKYRKGLESGVEFNILINSVPLDNSNATRVLIAKPTKITGISKYLYQFAKKISGLIMFKSTLHLLEISRDYIQLYDF